MTFYLEMREETIASLPVWSLRRTGPYGPENRALMEGFKAWLRAARCWGTRRRAGRSPRYAAPALPV